MQGMSAVYDNKYNGVNLEFYDVIFIMRDNSSVYGNGGAGVSYGHQQGNKIFTMQDNAMIYGNSGGVDVGMYASFIMTGGVIGGNTNSGVGLYQSATFAKLGGGIIYGNDAGENSNSKAVVWNRSYGSLTRTTTLYANDNISTDDISVGWGQ